MSTKEYYHVLNPKAFWMVNKTIAYHLKNRDAALYLSYLIGKHDYWQTIGELKKDGSFYVTQDHAENELMLSRYEQRKLDKILKDAGLINIQVKGQAPPRKYFIINIEKIDAIQSIPIVKKFSNGKLKDLVNIKNRDIIYKEESSKEDIENSTSSLKKSYDRKRLNKLNPLIEFWNKLEGATKHKRESKCYLSISNYLNQLQKGTFRKKNTWDDDWISKSTSLKFINLKWTDAMIKKAMTLLAAQAKASGHDQKFKRINLANSLYGFSTHTSRFIDAYSIRKIKKPPTKHAPQATLKQIEIHYDRTYTLIHCLDMPQSIEKKLEITGHIVGIKNEWDKMYSEGLKFNFKIFFNHYIDYLNKMKPKNPIQTYMLGPSNPHYWKQFEIFLRKFNQDKPIKQFGLTA